MAPTTRLSQQPERRINYIMSGQGGSRPNPIVVPEIPEPFTRSAGIVKKKAPVKHTSKPKSIVKNISKPQPKPKPKRDCQICACPRNIKYFPAELGVEVCAHLHDTCKYCIEKFLKSNMTSRRLQESELQCVVHGCEHVMSYQHVKAIVRKDIFERWDAELAQHHLRASETFIACLNPTCGHHFSIEDCNNEKASGRKKVITCPYCEYQLCVDCNRPWHPGTNCDKNKMAENDKSEAAIETLGAKPCPKCGVKIDKDGGCDHMTCKQCLHNFCWQCSVAYCTTMEHGPGCPHGNMNIAQDRGNYFDGPVNAIANAFNNMGAELQDVLHHDEHEQLPDFNLIPQLAPPHGPRLGMPHLQVQEQIRNVNEPHQWHVLPQWPAVRVRLMERTRNRPARENRPLQPNGIFRQHVQLAMQQLHQVALRDMHTNTNAGNNQNNAAPDQDNVAPPRRR